MKQVLISASLVLAAAPGEPLPILDNVPSLAKAAVARRLQSPPNNFHISNIKPSARMSGFVVCGTTDVKSATGGSAASKERFFVIVPGDFAILDRDGSNLIDTYWSLNQC